MVFSLTHHCGQLICLVLDQACTLSEDLFGFPVLLYKPKLKSLKQALPLNSESFPISIIMCSYDSKQLTEY